MRYTDWFEVIDERFRALILPNVHVGHLFGEGRWLEGPVYVPAAKHLLFSDIPNNRVLRLNECDGSVSNFASPSSFSNGQTLDPQGRVIRCEHLERRVVRIEHDGRVTVIAQAFQGKRLNSPNDVVADSRGRVWFTDPTYGISTEYEGARLPSETGTKNVYRVDPDGSVHAVVTDLHQPNGLALSLDETILYVVDSGTVPARLMAYDLSADLTAENARLLRACDVGMYDGFRLDRHGNIWTSAGDGVHCLAPDGTLLGKILIPETVANLCFGGPAGNRLYITATRGLYAVYLNTTSPRQS